MKLHRRFGRLFISAISVALTVLTALTVLGVQSLTLPRAFASVSDTPSHHIRRIALPHHNKSFKVLASHATYAKGKQPKPAATSASGNTPAPGSVTSAPQNCTTSDPFNTSCTPPLVWHNGPVQHNPRIYLIFWGPNWYTYSDTDGNLHADVQLDRMVTMFNGLAGSDYNNILSQYYDGDKNDPNTHIHNTTQLAGYIIDTTQPPEYLAKTMMGQEAADALSDPDLGWTNTADTQFLVFPQPGTAYGEDSKGGCGEHGYGTANEHSEYPTLTYGWEKYYPDPALDPTLICSADLSVVASHEYAEAATDPHADGSGWVTDEILPGDWKEIADLCNQVPADVDFAAVQKLWDNKANDCVSARGRLSVGSDPGDPLTLASGATGYAALTYGHSGCTALTSNLSCTGGLWPTIPGGHWIWATSQWDPNTQGANPVTFTKQFSIPEQAGIIGYIAIDADNHYDLQVNGHEVGTGDDFYHPDTYDVSASLVPGTNTITAEVRNDPGAEWNPSQNPVGLIFRADISYIGSSPAPPVSLSVVSDTSDQYSMTSGATGSAVITVGHAGCSAVDSNGICTNGVWMSIQPAIPAAHWIWPTVQWDPVNQGTNPVTFTKQFTIPNNALNITGQILIAADNGYDLQVNGHELGSGHHLLTTDTYNLSAVLHAGVNTITAEVTNDPGGDPYGNPAGLIYRADISYEL